MTRNLAQFYTFFIVANIWLVGAQQRSDLYFAALFFLIAVWALFEQAIASRKSQSEKTP